MLGLCWSQQELYIIALAFPDITAYLHSMNFILTLTIPQINVFDIFKMNKTHLTKLRWKIKGKFLFSLILNLKGTILVEQEKFENFWLSCVLILSPKWVILHWEMVINDDFNYLFSTYVLYFTIYHIWVWVDAVYGKKLNDSPS